MKNIIIVLAAVGSLSGCCEVLSVSLLHRADKINSMLLSDKLDSILVTGEDSIFLKRKLDSIFSKLDSTFLPNKLDSMILSYKRDSVLNFIKILSDSLDTFKMHAAYHDGNDYVKFLKFCLLISQMRESFVNKDKTLFKRQYDIFLKQQYLFLKPQIEAVFVKKICKQKVLYR